MRGSHGEVQIGYGRDIGENALILRAFQRFLGFTRVAEELFFMLGAERCRLRIYRKYVIELAELIFLQIEFVELIFGEGRVGGSDILEKVRLWF